MIVGCCFGEAQLSSTPNLVLNAQVHLEYAVGRNVKPDFPAAITSDNLWFEILGFVS